MKRAKGLGAWEVVAWGAAAIVVLMLFVLLVAELS